MGRPFSGRRVVEMAGQGPAPFGCMMLADHGADVVRVERPPATSVDNQERKRVEADPKKYFIHRGRRSIALDLRAEDDLETLLGLIERADVFVEPYRPGVAERLGIGPEVCLARNPKLVYARMTGWGQSGPMAQSAGHDIDYIAVAGALDNFRRAGEAPVAPLNIVADMGGGLLLAFGVAAALLEASTTGRGQVIDVAMVDAVALQLVLILGMKAQGRVPYPPGHNSIDSGAPYYEVYECADGKFIATGALETVFYRELLRVLNIDESSIPPRDDASQWPTGKSVIGAAFKTRSRDEWAEAFAGVDACVAPVLSFDEAPTNPHLAERGTYVRRDGAFEPAPAPRFSGSAGDLPSQPPVLGADRDAVLRDWGLVAGNAQGAS